MTCKIILKVLFVNEKSSSLSIKCKSPITGNSKVTTLTKNIENKDMI